MPSREHPLIDKLREAIAIKKMSDTARKGSSNATSMTRAGITTIVPTRTAFCNDEKAHKRQYKER